MSIRKKSSFIIFVLGASLISVFWMLSIHNALVFDDSTLLRRASLNSYDALFSFFPTSVYLDRPVRDILIKFMYDLFGTDYALHHAALVLVHLLNVVFAFLTARRLFAMKKGLYSDETFLGACITAVVFGAWPNSQMSVQWISRNNDLMGATFALLALLFYLRSIQEDKFKGQNVFLEILFYYLAIRSKEMFYPLPAIFLLCEFYQMLQKKQRQRLSAGAIGGIAVMVIFFTGILYGKLHDVSVTVNPDSPYYQTFNPITMVCSLLRYCMVYFDLTNGNFVYSFSVFGLIGLIVTLTGLAWAVVCVFKKHYELLFGYVAIGFSIAAVLPMVNQVHRLYLYFPAFFIGLTVAIAITLLGMRTDRCLVALCLCCCLAGNASGPKGFRRFWYSVGDMENRVYNQLQEIDKPVAESNVYVFLEDGTSYTPFYYGPGSIINLVFQDNTLNVSVCEMDDKVEYKKPYLVLSYTDGSVKEVERESDRTLSIEAVYPSYDENGALVLGVCSDRMSQALQIRIDGQAVPTVVGQEFISAEIPDQLYNTKESISITITDEYGTVSNVWTLPLNEDR